MLLTLSFILLCSATLCGQTELRTDLRAEMDVLAAISACPADTSPTNNFRSAPLGIKVFG